MRLMVGFLVLNWPRVVMVAAVRAQAVGGNCNEARLGSSHSQMSRWNVFARDGRY
jgi:hypothetical protein